MTLHRMVNGVQVDMTPEEEAEILAEWEANDPAKQPPPPPTLEEKVDALMEAAGISAQSMRISK